MHTIIKVMAAPLVGALLLVGGASSADATGAKPVVSQELPATSASGVIGSLVIATSKASIVAVPRAVSGRWNGWGYRLTRSETNQIANLSLWSAVTSVKRTALIPFSAAITGLYAINWVLTARNARAMGQCLGISWGGTGLIVNCNA